MRIFDIQPSPFRVGDFVQWQRSGTLVLNPPFQRRSVWKPANRAFLLDSVLRGLPVPLLFIREVVDLDTQVVRREVVDGQQRLRSLFAFIDPALLKDYDPDRDQFVLAGELDAGLARKSYSELTPEWKTRILEYKFAVEVLPTNFEDRDVLEIFARLNSTGYKLNDQELRNAEFFGPFKMRMYRLSYEQFERWRNWHVFSDDQLSRMLEVQLVSDLVMSMIDGLTGRSQKRLSDLYRFYEESFPGQDAVSERFRITMDTIDELLGSEIASTVFTSEVHFFSLHTYLYDVMWGLGSELSTAKGRRPPRTLRARLFELSRQFKDRDVPESVLDAVERASTDYGRRQTRLDYMHEVCG